MSKVENGNLETIFTTPVRTLTEAELQQVAGGGPFEAETYNKPSQIKIDSSGFFQ